MNERPILFSGAMVRAILEGRKTVTRRTVKGGQVPAFDPNASVDGMRWSAIGQRHPRYGFCVFGSTEEECSRELGLLGVCPYGKPGDRLWVRESTEADYDTHDAVVLARYCADKAPVMYWDEDDGELFQAVDHWSYPRDVRPSIHMTRAQARILLEITAVRVERLQDISEEQAKAEGAPMELAELERTVLGAVATYRAGFARLWQSINGAESWSANPWVWVVEFKRVMPVS